MAFYYGPLIAWMALIFTMSTQAGSSEHSLGLTERVLGMLAPRFLASLSLYQLDRIDLMVRKLGHVSEYMVLTLLAVRALQFGSHRPRRRALFGALALSLVYAATDELHQRFVPGRTPSPVDVLIDTAGAVLCMAGILLWFGARELERKLWAVDGFGRGSGEGREGHPSPVLQERGSVRD